MSAIFKKLAFGLQWSIAINDSKKELSTLIADHKGTAHAAVSSGPALAYGFANVKKASGTRSAAAIFATMHGDKSALFVHDLDAPSCALIAVDGGLPVEGMDQVGTRAEMLRTAVAYIAAQNELGKPPSLFGDADYADWGTQDYQVMPIEKLLEGYADIGKMHVVSDVKVKLAVIVAGSVLAVGAWFNNEIMDWFSPAKPTAAVVTPQGKYHQKVIERIAEIEKADLFRSDVMPAYSEFATKLPFSVPGWQMDKLVCKDNNCRGNWKRLKGGSAEVILAALKVDKNDPSVSFPSVDELQKDMKFERPLKPQSLEYSSNATLDARVLSWVQTLKDSGYDPKYGTPVKLVAPEANVVPAPADNILVGEYAITLPYRNLADVMQIPNSMTIEQIEVTTSDNKINAVISGKYYAR